MNAVRSGLRRYVTPLVLVLAAAAASIYAYVADRGSITDGERAMRPRNLFPAFRRDDVRRIELSHGAETMVLERDAGDHADGGDVGWTMAAPVAGKVELAAVDSLLGVLDFASIVRKVDGDPPPIAAPRVRGVIAMGTITYRFTLDGPAATPEGAAYLTLDGEGTFVVGRELVTELSKTADTYRDRTIVPYLSIDLRRLEVRPAGRDGDAGAGPADAGSGDAGSGDAGAGLGDAGGFAVDRIDDTSFRLQRSAVRASRETLDRVWSALAEMRAETFLRGTDWGSAAPSLAYTITMVPRDPSRPPGELAVFDACPGHDDAVAVVRRTPTPLAVCVPKVVLGGLGTREDELADRRLFATRAEEVEEIRLDDDPRRLELARRAGGWHERSPVDRDLGADEADLATDLVKALVTGEGTLVAPPPGFAIATRARVWRGEPRTEELVEVGAVGAKSYAQRVSDGAFVEIAPALRARFALREIRGRAVWDPPIDGQATSIVLRGCGVDQELARDDHGFHYVHPTGVPADTGRAIDLADALARVRAEAWISTDADPLLLGAPGCSAIATFPRDGSSRTAALRFGSRPGDDGRYLASADGVRGVFAVPASLVDLAHELYVDRNALFTPPETIVAITVSAPGRPDARFVADAGASESSDAGTSVAFDLGHLRAEAAVHLGPALAAEGFDAKALVARVALTGAPHEKRIVFGAPVRRGERDMHYARVDGVDATFVVADDRVAALLAMAAPTRSP